MGRHTGAVAVCEKSSIAIVAPYLFDNGGITGVTHFLCDALDASTGFRPHVVSVATSASDHASARLRSPATWLRGVRVEESSWEGRPVAHVGALLTEFEFQRYAARRPLTEILRGHDLVQIVAGTPNWGCIARDVDRPVAMQVASMTREERRARLARGRGPLGLWRRAMAVWAGRLDRLGLRHVDLVFVENSWMLDRLERVRAGPRIVFAPPGIDTDLFYPDVDSSRGGYLLCVGRLADPRKNVSLLFRAYERLRRTLPDAPPLILAGSSGPTADDWQLARSLGIRSSVTSLGCLAREDLARLYREAGLFWLSSEEEGLGLVALEAMASGVPVVSTDCGGISTVVADGETGFIVQANDADALSARARQLLLDGDLRRRFGENARQRAVTHFSLEASARVFLAGYESLLRDPPARRRARQRHTR